MSTQNEKLGLFSWYSLMTTDATKAISFYSELFGWKETQYDIPGQGTSTLFENDGKSFGGIISLENSAIPSHWLSYISVADVDKAQELAKKNGGAIAEKPFDIPTIGRCGLIQDPNGAYIFAFTPENFDCEISAQNMEVGGVCWNELMTDDPQKTTEFYSKVFGWVYDKMTNDAAGAKNSDYYIIKKGDSQLGGIMQRPDNIPKNGCVWLPYVSVDNIESSTERATQLGGKIVIPKMEIPNMGSLSLLTDPTGAYFYTWRDKKQVKAS